MAARLEWKEPVVVRQWRWQSEELPQIRTFFRLFSKWLLLLGLPALLIVYHFAPTELPRTAIAFFGIALLKPVALAAQLWVDRKRRIRYSITEKGLRRHTGHGTLLYRWQTVESC